MTQVAELSLQNGEKGYGTDHITVTIPREWIMGFPGEDLTYKQIFRPGIRQYKIKRAVQLYRDDVGSPGYISEQLGLPKQDLIRELRLCEIEPDFSEKTVQEELAE